MSLDDRNKELEEKLQANPIDSQIATLVMADRRRKDQIRLLAFSILLDVLLTFGFGYMTLRTNHLASLAESNKSALIARCESTNDARAKNEKLWDYLINQGKDQPRTPEQQKFFNDFVTLKTETFAPTDCSKIVL